MKEARGNLWEYPADIRVITTNGDVNKAGEAVMGRGCALEAKKKFPGIADTLGSLLYENGNRPYWLRTEVDSLRDGLGVLITFPVKRHWHENADIELIRASADLLVGAIDGVYPDKYIRIVLPRPGCGNGGLFWEDVKPIIEPILDDRFTCITF